MTQQHWRYDDPGDQQGHRVRIKATGEEGVLGERPKALQEDFGPDFGNRYVWSVLFPDTGEVRRYILGSFENLTRSGS